LYGKKQNLLNAMRIIYVWLLFLVGLVGCQTGSKFPEVKKLSEYKKTNFVPTLESSFSSDKNAIYCVTLLYAWDGVRNIVREPLKINPQFTDLILLNDSKSFKGVLNPDEYKISSDVSGEEIVVKAEFKKSLPFETKLTDMPNHLQFNGQKVAAFGVWGGDKELTRKTKILYYKNDDDFIIKILPKDQEHEIILYKPSAKFQKLQEVVFDIERKSKLGEEEAPLNWKYSWTKEDILTIPKLQFNIEHNYPTIERKSINATNRELFIVKAWQKTAFILNESGAEIEGKVEITATDESPKPDKKPKNMLFNKPFFVMLKKNNSENPYFGAWIANTELMTTQP